ncbi:WXG100 family type VII secretion target [Rhodococcoides yunnanense]|uniref:WXG100 family type VII secretion target n=1 Tax=Rhodococcoides yunnanense TaxID=278209 RepID=UPI0009340573|nr:WXG100 family type VII secretion target [Rhodococcus yunnanensis]
MAFWGQDIEQVQQLSRELNNKANEIQGVLTRLTSQLNGVQWKGPDADRFRSEWQGTHTAQLKAVVNALQQASQTASRNAQQQQQTSSSS